MRIWYFVLSLILSSGLAHAQGFTLQELRQAVISRDFAALDAGLEAAQAEFLAGQRSADDMRALYIALSRSAPEVITGVEAWLAADPENPKAQIARAWSLYEAAGHIRSAGNPYSHNVADLMMREGHGLATRAYQGAPYLIPASDAVIRNYGQIQQPDVHPLEVMNGVLLTHPNWGTVDRAILTFHLRNTSGSTKRKFCEAAAFHFPKTEQAALLHRCKMRLAIVYGGHEMTRYMRQHLWSDTSPETLIDRLSFAIQNHDIMDLTDGQITWAIVTLMTAPADQYDMIFLGHLAQRLESKLHLRPRPDGWVFHDFKRRRLPQVERFLEHDPSNLDLLDLAEGMAFASDYEMVRKADGSTHWKMIRPERTKEQRKAEKALERAHRYDFATRRMRSSPYDASGWLDFALAVEGRNLPYSFFDGDDAYQNNIAFARDTISALATFVHHKSVQWETWHAVTGRSSKELSTPLEWSAFFKHVDENTQLICPLLRAQLVREHLCRAASNRPDCASDAFPRPKLTQTLTEVGRNTPSCASLLSADIDELWFTPVSFREVMAEINGS